jgi:hypothetical protein
MQPNADSVSLLNTKNETLTPITPTQIDKETSNIYKRATLVALPFLSLYKPLAFPISLGNSAKSLYGSTYQLIIHIPSKDCKKISFYAVETTIAVIALASTIFNHPIGRILTTSKDTISKLSTLAKAIEKGDTEGALVSLIKIINNGFSIAVICNCGIQISMASLGMKTITLIISSIDEFKKDRLLEGYGDLLMTAIKINTIYSKYKMN